MKRRIYLSGAMQDIAKNDSTLWRINVKEGLRNFKCFDPWEHFDFDSDCNEREVMEFDLWNLRQSDLVIVNFNYVRSLGTMAELAIAYDRGIPIIGLCESRSQLHPWQKMFCMSIFENINELIVYINEHF